VTVVLVVLAGAGGVLLRYGISTGFHGDALPWATIAINVVGSFLLGLLVVAHWASPQTRTALGVGFLGGFTTFSTFSERRRGAADCLESLEHQWGSFARGHGTPPKLGRRA
jgi:fluoride ion exporter CrcB/FEX